MSSIFIIESELYHTSFSNVRFSLQQQRLVGSELQLTSLKCYLLKKSCELLQFVLDVMPASFQVFIQPELRLHDRLQWTEHKPASAILNKYDRDKLVLLFLN